MTVFIDRDHLEKSYNMEIQQNAAGEIQTCKDYVFEKYGGRISYEFVEVEGEGEIGPIIDEYIQNNHPDLNLLVVGTRNLGGLKKWVLGSVSDYCIHHIKCPVTVVKEHSD